jgi:hypothetical protein
MAAFRDIADPAAHDVAGRGPQQVMAIEADPPCGAGGQPENRLQGGRLAGPVGADDAHRLARPDLDADAVHGADPAVTDRQVHDLEKGSP